MSLFDVLDINVKQLGGLIVSCQPVPGSPLDKPEIVAAMALAAVNTGAVAVRIEGLNNLKATRELISVPIIGIIKRDLPDSPVRITPFLEDVDALAQAGADFITLHPETINGQAFRLIEEIRRHGMKVGLILNPETPVEAMKYYIHKADKITVMTVDPGFAGQPFIPEMLEKIGELKAWREREGLNYEIEIDGSCNKATYQKLMAAGADVFIVGTSGLFNHAEKIEDAWQIMVEQILAAKHEVLPHAKTA